MKATFSVVTSIDTLRSSFDDSICPEVEIEYEATFTGNMVVSTKLLSIEEIPPKGIDARPKRLPIDSIPFPDLRWIMSTVHKDASERWEEA